VFWENTGKRVSLNPGRQRRGKRIPGRGDNPNVEESKHQKNFIQSILKKRKNRNRLSNAANLLGSGILHLRQARRRKKWKGANGEIELILEKKGEVAFVALGRGKRNAAERT